MNTGMRMVSAIKMSAMIPINNDEISICFCFLFVCGYPNAIGSKIQSAKISDRVMNPPMISSVSLMFFYGFRLS